MKEHNPIIKLVRDFKMQKNHQIRNNLSHFLAKDSMDERYKEATKQGSFAAMNPFLNELKMTTLDGKKMKKLLKTSKKSFLC